MVFTWRGENPLHKLIVIPYYFDSYSFLTSHPYSRLTTMLTYHSPHIKTGWFFGYKMEARMKANQQFFFYHSCLTGLLVSLLATSLLHVLFHGILVKDKLLYCPWMWVAHNERLIHVNISVHNSFTFLVPLRCYYPLGD